MKKLGFAVVLVLILFNLCLSRAAVQLTPPAQPIPATYFGMHISSRGTILGRACWSERGGLRGHFDAMAHSRTQPRRTTNSLGSIGTPVSLEQHNTDVLLTLGVTASRALGASGCAEIRTGSSPD